MADFNKLKGTIRGAIYPNGRGAISADKHQAALLDMADTMQETDAKVTELSGENYQINQLNSLSLYEQQYTQLIPFELGNIGIYSDGWTYISSKSRVRTPEGYILHLFPGDVIALTDYTDARYYWGCRDNNDKYTYGGWLTQDYTVVTEGYYVILVSNIAETAQSSVDALGNLVCVTRKKTISKQISDLENGVGLTKAVGALVGKQAILISNRYVNNSGELAVSNNMDSYIIEARNAKALCVETGGDVNEGALAVSFYRGNVTSSDFISGIGLQKGIVVQNVTIPAGTKTIVVSNRRSVLATAGIYLCETNNNTAKVNAKNFCEMGNIQILNSGWDYPVSTTRARTIYKCALHLAAGDRIISSGKSEFYVGGRLMDGAYISSSNWVTEYIVLQEGYYVFVARFASETAPKEGNQGYITEDIDIYSIYADENTARFREIQSPLTEWDSTIRSVNHRGYNTMSPENTLPAFKLSRTHGFRWVETDVRFSKDGEIVCIHDATVDRTSNGTGKVSDMTLAQLKGLDFGSWFSEQYSGVTIPTLVETLTLCRQLGLCVYIEVKDGLDEARAKKVVDIVRSCGMAGKVNYISEGIYNLTALAAIDSESRLGLVVSSASATAEQQINEMLEIKTNYGNDVFIDAGGDVSEFYELCVSKGIDVEHWTLDNITWLSSTKPMICGVTSNYMVAGKYYYLESNFENRL